ncbi:hypothetical protein N6H18_07825 [Reichenbachiella agarivorans]|uniref:GDSL-like Lipase/Acylhydrolase n=1 Tax=Reichenbachiella agarivorans TaxID=2979464 RepID=A0ABY6CTK5_9BACT|nr:hypothetical protein [Reichenbachiella agarivorans]UXP33852.1 hypothetical protein N6H18_07825 [Reichenbachiella agarivorans]
MKSINIYISLLAFSILAFGCDEEDKLIDERLENTTEPIVVPETGTSGSLDLSTYVAIGSSISGGMMDGALYTHAQNNSFTVLLAKQFAIDGVGGGEFNVPSIESVNGYLSTNADGSINGKYILDLDSNNDGVLGDAGLVVSVGELPSPYTGDKAKLNNFGVPGIQTAQMLTPLTGGPADGNPAYNALYARFASNPGTSTILGDAVARNPTFFTLWAGSNDVLGYAISGGTNEAILTDPATFDGYLNAIVNTLISGTTAKGVICNVPNVLTLPHFRAVPYNAIPMTDQTTVDATNSAYASYNGGVQAALTNDIIDEDEATLRTISYVIGGNGIVIEDPTLTDVAALSGGQIPIPKYRQLKDGELVLLPASTVLGTLADPENPASVYGVGVPLPDKYSLRTDELTKVVTNLTAINTSIKTIADNQERIVLFDAYTLLLNAALSGGYSSSETGGFMLTPDFTPNGFFSNDGVHPNPRGQAILTNEIIDLLEEEFDASIPKLDVMQYSSSPFQQ